VLRAQAISRDSYTKDIYQSGRANFAINMSIVEQILIIVISALMICLLTGLSGIERNMPDFVHVDFGLPIPWRRHTLNTIAGPVDKWELNLVAFAIDLVFWLVVIGSIMMALFLMSVKAPVSF